MNYYILKPAVNTKETGSAYPAVESYSNYDFNAPNSAHKLKFNEFPDFIPDVRFTLAKGAKLCDMMGQATINARGFLVSEKLKNAFEQFNIVPHKYYSAKIEDHQGNIHNYFWMHLVWKEGKNFVDWNNSEFYKKRLSKNLGEVVIKNEEDILTERKKCDVATLINFQKILLRDHGLDLFMINFFTEVYSTENLKTDFEKKKLTGIDFTKADKLSSSGLQTQI